MMDITTSFSPAPPRTRRICLLSALVIGSALALSGCGAQSDNNASPAASGGSTSTSMGSTTTSAMGGSTTTPSGTSTTTPSGGSTTTATNSDSTAATSRSTASSGVTDSATGAVSGEDFCAALVAAQPQLDAAPSPDIAFVTLTLALVDLYDSKNATESLDASKMDALAASCPEVAAKALKSTGKASFAEFR